ncbi:MAG: hypothetical protein IPL77_19645 [Flavobacteriales bacterium]|jgi:hypothetical protein|nr:hypothetical protein [Flavobacteriales bacterium]MBK9538562.1 hypothetical protein [Flavobacteriales bacterium]
MRRSTVLLVCVPVMPVVATTYPIAAQAAIRNNMGSAPLISCNEMDQTANGILFNGVAYNTDVRGNKMRHHKWALHLDGTAVIGTQTLKGNLWYNAAGGGGVCALYEDTANAPNFPFYYNPATINGGSTAPPSVWPMSGWFVVVGGTNYDCADHHGEPYCSQFHTGHQKDKLTDLDVRVANDSLENDPYTNETKWILKGGLYKKLDDNPELQDSLQTMAELYDDLQGSTTADLKAIDDQQLSLYDLDSTVVAQLHVNRTQIDSLLALVKDGLEQLGDSSLTPAQRQALITSLGGYRQNIRDLSTWNATALQWAADGKSLMANNVQAANTNITVNELIQENEKVVNDIYLATVGQDIDSFTTTQADGLFDIANQCPMLGGNAVFKARSLYWLIDDTYDFDDASLCLPWGIIVKNMAGQATNTVSVVPNPASNEATLVLSRALDEPGVFVLYDGLGAEVMRRTVPVELPRLTFNIASLAPALYHYDVRGPSGLIGNGKLTIVR